MADLSKKEWEKYEKSEEAKVFKNIATVMHKGIQPGEVAEFYDKWADDNNQYEKVDICFCLLPILTINKYKCIIHMTNFVLRKLNISCIMFKISVLYNTLQHDSPCYVLLTCGKHVHDRIISLRGQVWVDKTILSLQLFIEVPVPSHGSERSCICV